MQRSLRFGRAAHALTLRSGLPLRLRHVLAVLVAIPLLLASAAVAAAADTWTIESLFSNADGDVQFVVLHEAQGRDGQGDLVLAQLTATGRGFTRTYTFDHSLPSTQTANRRVLIATPGFAALGIVTPDYVMPARFLPADGGTLDFRGLDAFAYAPLPVDGTSARLRNGSDAGNVATNFAAASGSVPAAPVTAVEFYNATLDHYFVSALAPDIDALDEGRIAGWQRTGYTFRVYPAAAGAPAAAQPVCRYYIPPEHGNSHFISAFATECAAVAARIGVDPNYSGYELETASAFFVATPNDAGACALGTVPVYRVWNARVDSNHRYTTSLDVRSAMLARGYVAEGAGIGVAMCAPAADDDHLVRVSAPSTLAPGCTSLPAANVVYRNGEVEPRIAVDPRDPDHLVGVWQQDRISTGAAAALLTGASFDGGRTWTRSMPAFTHCSGGTSAAGTAFQRASDPWLSIAPDGTVHQIGIALSGINFTASSDNAVLATRSSDGGRTWSTPVILRRDGGGAFNDKESLTADPNDARFVYATWDRLVSDRGVSWFASSADGGATWDTARAIYDPGANNQTLNNQIVVLPDGTLIDFFTEFIASDQSIAMRLVLIRSADRGATWSAPVPIADMFGIDTVDPATSAAVRDAVDIGSIAVGPQGDLAVVWQDARFNGLRNAVAFSRSLDGGFTWSPPVAINAVPGVQAFVPTVQVRADGVYGVTYYDFRNDTASPNTLPTDYWLTQSSDGVTWRETHVSGPFDLLLAPIAGGYFLGDYESLGVRGNDFVAFFAQTTWEAGNPTDIYSWQGKADAVLGAGAKARSGSIVASRAASGAQPSPLLRSRASAAARAMLERRRTGLLAR
jgi:hypothetical protein